jgi:hypothetical protein
MTEKRDDDLDEDAPPPFMGSWNRLYALTLAMLLFWMIVFYWFTKAFE